jgi:ElaB/YqjD/DUF883 family membrane-anchored ribosome-binding protein
MENETEVIREQMTETRTALTEKLEALEEHVAATVQQTTATVTETLGSVKEAVQNTVESVTGTVQNTVDSVTGSVQNTVESVKETFDLPRQVQNHPWAMFGGAVAVGYVAGRLLPEGTSSRSSNTSGWRASSNFAEPAPSPRPSQASQGPSMLSGVTDALAPSLHKLQGMAIGAIAGMVGDMIIQAAPEDYRSQLREMVDEFTTNLGGTPLKGSRHTS